MALHKDIPIGENHIPHQWEYADASAREGATGFVSADVGKLARQLNNNTLWMLTAVTPTWIQVGEGAGSHHASSHQNGGDDEVATATPAANAIPKANGSGKLDSWVTADAAASTSSLRKLGTGTTDACAGDDSRLANERPPTAHSASHKNGGSDEVATSTPAANAIPKAGGDGKLASGFIPQIDHTTLANKGTNTHSDIDSHLSSTSNPHSTTKSQVGLGNVTDDAQLKRAAGDFATFTEKSTPVAADLVLIEDSEASGAKKKVQALNFRRWKQSAMSEVAADTSSTSSSWADLLTLNMTTVAGYLLIQASAAFSCSNGSQRQMGLRLVVDGTPIRAVSVASDQTTFAKSLAIVHRVAVASGAHTVKLQWIVGSGYTIRCRPVTNPDSEHCVLTVQEVIA